jgi:hypothetical protein
MTEEIRPVPDAEIARWVNAAHKSRLASYMLDQVRDPLPGTSLACDDEAYRWEKCSAWTRSALVAATDHLIVWANIVAPQTVFEGMVVRNPPRPYYTLARAGLECAAQAVWVLDQDTSSERMTRHLRLLYHDLRQMAVAFEVAGDQRAAWARERMDSIRERLGDADLFETLKKHEPKYSTMVRDCADAIEMAPAELEVLWRSASAAAHGKNWFQQVGYATVVGDEYEPGYFRAILHPDPAAITPSVTAAANLTMYGVLRFITRAGHDPEPISRGAFDRLRQETPLKD